MPSPEHNLAERSGNLFESHKGYDPRLRLYYFVCAVVILVLTGGLAYQQLIKTDIHHEREKFQSQRRVVIPGPRGNIYDRNGQVLVRNRPRLAVVLYLDELEPEFNREFRRIRTNYRETGEKELPTAAEMSTLARISIVQGYQDQVNEVLGVGLQVDAARLSKHFKTERALPYPLIEDLQPSDYAQLIERLPVRSPLQLYTSNTREYPFGSAAAHTLGYVGTIEEKDDNERIKTFKAKGTIGREGLERSFDAELQGEPGSTIFNVDPAGYKVNKSLIRQAPVQGKNLVTSLDIDLQITAEQTIGDRTGAAVAIDIKTGEVLALCSKPDYDLSETAPRISDETWKSIIDRDALLNQAIGGAYPPGSTFKLLTSIAALRAGVVTPDDILIDCQGTMLIGKTPKTCDNGHGHHGEVNLSQAIAVSCDLYYYTLGLKTSIEAIAAEARRFHLDQRTGIELPLETSRMLIPDPDWKRRVRGENWFPGDTANVAIGQGDVLVTPLEMACFAASIARDETFTTPTLRHDPKAPTQHHESIGLTPTQRAALLAGMEGCTQPPGTAKILTTIPALRVPGVRIAGKTGTAQKDVYKDGKLLGKINFAWFICFAPAEKPEIAVAVMLEGDTIGEGYGGGDNAAPVASAILKKYFDKQAHPNVVIQPFKTAGN
jgi:penicillin-binding protein 2